MISENIEKALEKVLELFVLILIFLIPNLGVWLCLFDINDPLSFCTYKIPWIEITWYILAIGAATWLLSRKKTFLNLVEKLKQNLTIILFCLFAITSLAWSALPIATLYQLLVMLFTTYLAIFIGSYFLPNRWFSYLFWFCGIVLVASVELLIVFPHAAIMEEPHLGSWRGILWHKNFTGSFLALANMIFLLFGISAKQDRGKIIVAGALYILSCIYIFFSLSAAGIAMWACLNLAVIILAVWIKIRHKLRRQHYLILGIAILFIVIITIPNTKVIFNLLNREPSLTGRMPLWNYLLTSTVSQHPLIGHGFGAIWMDKNFRQQVTTSQGWGFIITNGHNGFMDMLLNLGSIGVFLIVLIFFTAFFRSWKYFYNKKSMEAAFPLLLVLYVFLANLSISYLLEFESFHWLLLISAIFQTSIDKG